MLDFDIRHSLRLQELTQALVLVDDSARSRLDLCGRCDTRLLAGAILDLELLEVLLPSGTRTTLVVADAGEVRSLLEWR